MKTSASKRHKILSNLECLLACLIDWLIDCEIHKTGFSRSVLWKDRKMHFAAETASVVHGDPRTRLLSESFSKWQVHQQVFVHGMPEFRHHNHSTCYIKTGKDDAEEVLLCTSVSSCPLQGSCTGLQAVSREASPKREEDGQSESMHFFIPYISTMGNCHS